jgi:hypothetical protein
MKNPKIRVGCHATAFYVNCIQFIEIDKQIPQVCIQIDIEAKCFKLVARQNQTLNCVFKWQKGIRLDPCDPIEAQINYFHSGLVCELNERLARYNFNARARDTHLKPRVVRRVDKIEVGHGLSSFRIEQINPITCTIEVIGTVCTVNPGFCQYKQQ